MDKSRVDRNIGARLIRKIQGIRARYSGLVGHIEWDGTDVVTQVTLSLDQHPSRFGWLLEELDRQGQLIRLLHLHFAEAKVLTTWYDESATDLLRIQMPLDTPSEEVDKFVQLFEGLLEALSLRRADVLLRPYAGRSTPCRTPYIERDDYYEAPSDVVGEAAPCGVIWELSYVWPGKLARLDSSLLVYDDDETDSVGAMLATQLKPFLCGISRIRANHRVLERHEICVPVAGSANVSDYTAMALALVPQLIGQRVALNLHSAAEDLTMPRTNWLFCDGSLAAQWILQQVTRQIEQIGQLQGMRVFIEFIDGTGARHSKPEDDAQIVITQILPGMPSSVVSLRHNSIIVDLFGVLNLRPTPQLLAKNIVYIQGATINIGSNEFPALLGDEVKSALLETVLLELSDPGGLGKRQLRDAADFAALAEAHAVSIDALHDFWGEIEAPRWQAFFARSHGELEATDMTEAVTAMHPSLVKVSTGEFNISDQIFCEQHLRSSSKLIDPLTGTSIGYAELQRLAESYAGRLRALGLQQGDAMAFIGADGIPATALMLACLFGGWVFAPLNPMVSTAHFESMLKAVCPRIVLYDPLVADQYCLAFQDVAYLRVDEFLRLGAQPLDSPVRLRGDAPAVALFTSGSTGAPKAVAHTHADFLHCSLNYARHVMGLRANDCVYTPSRIFFAYGLNNMMQSLLAGASHVLAAPLPRDRRVVDIISMYRVTAFLAVPAIYKIALTEGKPRPNLCSLRLCISAGEKLPVKLYWEAKAYFGVTVLDGIGNTEAISTFISNRMSGATHNCTGRLVPGFKVRLINERGELCRVGEVGVLWVKGNTLTKGYINDEPATSVHFVDGWFNTQDMFFMDATRRFYNVGRVGSIIKINASWFSPDLLESALQAHPAVKECAVCMAHDDYGLPRPKAFVVVDSSHEAPDDLEQLWQELRTLSKDRLGRNHYPHHFSVVAELPRTSSGKLIRSALVATSLQ